MPPKHADMVAQMKRLIANVDAKTTTLADSTLELPAALYLDEEYWRREVKELFHRRPIVLALSCEVRENNSYVTLDVPGFRILVTRDKDGVAHAFFNACSHRGAPVAEGKGCIDQFSCPYHAWSYSTRGELLGIPGSRLFGAEPNSKLNLKRIKVEERHGLIFGVLEEDAPLDLDDWLGAYGDELEQVHLSDCHPMWSHSFSGPNWKFCKDGFIENYHFARVHGQSLPNLIGNINVTDTWGIHSRMLLPDKAIRMQAQLPEDQWDPPAAFATVYYMFPNIMIASCWGEWPLITRLFPGRKPDETTCVQTLLSRHEPTPEVLAEAKSFEAAYKQITQDEDFVLDYAIQHAVENSSNRTFTLGRNECALQHYHQVIAKFVAPPSGE